MRFEDMTIDQQRALDRAWRDHAEFCRRSLIVETESEQLVPMELGAGQLKLDAEIRRQEALQRRVQIIYLKSRRIQATTGTAAQFFQRTAFRAGIHTLVFAHDTPSVENIFRIYQRFHDRYKPFAGLIRLPQSRALTDRLQYSYGGDEKSSYIQIQTAGNADFGRGFRASNVHFSEFPYYERPRQLLNAVMAAVPRLPGNMVVIEGTAKAIGDEFHSMWQAATEGRSEWAGLFMGWWEHRSNRMPLPMDDARFHASLTTAEGDMMRRFNLDLQQIAWRRYVIANEFNGDESSFRREHPATPEDAFSASSRTRFSIPHIQRMPIRRDAMRGDLEENEVGGEKRIMFQAGEYGALTVFRMPERGKCYAAGADAAGGADLNEGKGDPDTDFACTQILDRDTGEQCAVLRLRAMPGAFGRYLFRLLRWYNNAQACVEKTGVGIATIEALLNCGYPASLIYHRPVNPDQDPATRSDKIGWNTDEVSRQQLLSLLDEAIRAGSVHVYDPVTQSELLTFVVSARGKAEAQRGCHDDTVMALAFALIVMARMPRPVQRDPERMRPEIQYYGKRQDDDARGQKVRLLR